MAEENKKETVEINLDLKSIHPQRLGVAVASVLGIVGSFMDWFKFEDVDAVGGTDVADGGLGWYTILLFVICLATVFLGKLKEPVKPRNFGVLLATGVSAALFGVMQIAQIKTAIDDSKYLDSDDISFKFGIYLIILSGLAIAGILQYFKYGKKK